MRRLALALVLAAFAAAAPAVGAGGAPIAVGAESLVLLPRDLPAGYSVWDDDSDCFVATGVLDHDGPGLGPLLEAKHPSLCNMMIRWEGDDVPRYTPEIQASVYRFRTVEAARRGFAIRDEFASMSAGLFPTSRAGVRGLGDEAELLRDTPGRWRRRASSGATATSSRSSPSRRRATPRC